MAKIAFVGFGEVNTPIDIIVKKCSAAAEGLEKEGLDLIKVFPVTDDYEEKDIRRAIDELKGKDFDALVVCIAGWIPTHAVVKITEYYRDIPMVLWGLCGWMESDGRLVTTADQAGTSALRKTFYDLGYTFKYIYDIIGLPSNTKKVAAYVKAASAAKKLRHARGGMAGYRDMNLYGTQIDGPSLKREIGPELETFEMLEIQQRYEKITAEEKQAVIDNAISKWNFLKPAKREGLIKAACISLRIILLVLSVSVILSYTTSPIALADGIESLLSPLKLLHVPVHDLP